MFSSHKKTMTAKLDERVSQARQDNEAAHDGLMNLLRDLANMPLASVASPKRRQRPN